MKGPFFVKDPDFFRKDVFVPAKVCKDCAWLAEDETCCMQDCPFIGYSDEMDEEDPKGE